MEKLQLFGVFINRGFMWNALATKIKKRKLIIWVKYMWMLLKWCSFKLVWHCTFVCTLLWTILHTKALYTVHMHVHVWSTSTTLLLLSLCVWVQSLVWCFWLSYNWSWTIIVQIVGWITCECDLMCVFLCCEILISQIPLTSTDIICWPFQHFKVCIHHWPGDVDDAKLSCNLQ